MERYQIARAKIKRFTNKHRVRVNIRNNMSLYEVRDTLWKWCEKEGIKIYKGDSDDECYAYICGVKSECEIELCPRSYSKRVTYRSLFEFMHEVGHIITANFDHIEDTWEDEYWADQWAIDMAKRFGIVFPKRVRNEFQGYLDEYDEDEKIIGLELDWD